MTVEVIIGQGPTGNRFSLNSNSTKGNRVVGTPIPPTPIPEYWWRADSGLSTSGWTAYAGGINFTFFNVASADSVNGVLFNGTNGYGVTSNLAANIDAKHVMMRIDSLVKPAGSLKALNGSTVNNVHQSPAYFNSGGFYWYFVEYTGPSTITYAARGTNNIINTSLWADFTNGGTSINLYEDQSGVAYTHSAYSGTFTNRMRWPSGYGMYIGRRQEGNYANFYLKEFAIFTTALSAADANLFRNSIYDRWP